VGGAIRPAVSVIQVDAMSGPHMLDLSEGRWAQVTVEDTGEGMPEEVVSCIFETCFAAKRSGRGSGLVSAHVYATHSSMTGRSARRVTWETRLGTLGPKVRRSPSVALVGIDAQPATSLWIVLLQALQIRHPAV